MSADTSLRTQDPAKPLPVSGAETNDGLYSLATALNEIIEGVVFVDSFGHLVWHNRSFDKLLVDNSEGHLLVTAIIDFAGECFEELEAAYDSDDSPRDLVSMVREVTVGRIAHELHCTLMARGVLAPESYLLCLVKRSASRWSNYEEHLRQTWGLTVREAQVAIECLRGNKNLEIAERLKISVETVNKHLDKVYQKARVRGRAELASRLLDGVF